MKQTPGRRNPVARLFRTMVEARWFFTFTSSLCATVIGITLTFGINSCRESRRARKEMQKSMLQAVDNINDRFGAAETWLARIEDQNRIYTRVDSIYQVGQAVPDSLCEEFKYTIPYIRLSAFDHQFEKIFRGSYQLWQVQSANDSLAFYIGLCYDGLNTVEYTCEELTSGLLEQLGASLAQKQYRDLTPREWTETVLSDPQFQYFMSIRRVKTAIASEILQQAKNDYDTKVIWRSEELRR